MAPAHAASEGLAKDEASSSELSNRKRKLAPPVSSSRLALESSSSLSVAGISLHSSPAPILLFSCLLLLLLNVPLATCVDSLAPQKQLNLTSDASAWSKWPPLPIAAIAAAAAAKIREPERANLNASLALVLNSSNNNNSRRHQKAAASTGSDEASDELKMSGVRRLLVRQLTSLIMNNEPEMIADQMEGTSVSGQLTSEPLELGELEQLGPPPIGADEPQMLVSQGAAGKRDDYATNSSGDQGDGMSQNYGQQGVGMEEGISLNETSGAEEQYVTCPPDYEDQTMAESSGSTGVGGGNLTAEQQQQLLAGADSSGLLANEQQRQAAAGGRQLSPCIHAGLDHMDWIEVITKVITPILFSVIIVVGLVGNIVVMIVILEDRKTDRELTPTGLLILDLSLADLSFIIFCIPFTGWDYAVGHWVFGSLWCKFNQYLIVVCALSSIYTLVLMSVDRFAAIVYPIESMAYRTSKNTLNAIYIKWILILLLATPTIQMHGLIESPLAADQFTCRFLADQYNPLHFQIVFFITSYLFPLILIFCLYYLVLKRLWFGSKPQGHKESLKTLESKKKVTWLVMGIVVVFALCWCPIQVMLILMRLRTHKITATYVAIQVFSHILGYMNSCVNPIVYAFASESFLNSFKRSSLGRFFYTCFCCPHKNQHHNQHHHFGHHNQQVDLERSTAGTNNFRTNHHHQHNQHNHTATTSLLNDHTTNCNTAQNNSQHQNHNNPNLSVNPLAISGGEGAQLAEGSPRASTPLEPRDRPAAAIKANCSSSIDKDFQVRSAQDLTIGQPPLATQIIARQKNYSASQQQISSINDTGGGGGGSCGASGCNVMLTSARAPAKQQLVARMVASGNQVSHKCEPCYQQEPLRTP